MPVQIERIAYFDWPFAMPSDGLAFHAIPDFIMECGETEQWYCVPF